MTDVVIYTRPWCGFCSRAKSLLDRHGVPYEELVLDGDPDLERQMIQRSNGRMTVPQVFVRGEHVGGSAELAALASRGGLDRLRAAAAAPDGTGEE